MNDANTKPGETGTVQSVRRAMDIVEKLRENDGARVSELAAEYGLAKSTIHGYLATLERAGYLVKDGDEYRVGTMFMRLGEHARTSRPEYKMAAEKVKELAEQSEERAQFAIQEKKRVVFLYRRSGIHAVNTGTKIGLRRYLHTSSVGKAILAYLPEEEIHDIIDTCGLPKVTEHTITVKDAMLEELAEIRERGYAVNMEENIEGLCAIGAPVQTEDGDVIGGLSVSGPTHRLKGGRLHGELADLVRGEVNELELNIKYS